MLASRSKPRHAGIGFLALALGLGVTIAGCSAETGGGTGGETGEEFTLTYTTFLPEQHEYSRTHAAWMELVTEKTDGQVQFDTFYEGSLCASAEAFGCLESGRADLGFDSPTYTPQLIGANLPHSALFTSNDTFAVTAAMEQMRTEFPEIDQEYADRNQRVLTFHADMPSVIALVDGTNAESLADLDGYALRAASFVGVALSALGVEPTSVAPEDMYEALQRGVVQGVAYSLPALVQQSLTEVAPEVVDVVDLKVTSVGVFNMNLETWDSLPESVHDAMLEANEEVFGTPEGIYYQIQNEAIAAACEGLDEAGIEITSLGGDAEGEAWKKDALELLSSEWKGRAGAVVSDPDAMWDRYVELASESEGPGALTWEERCAAA